MGGVRLGGSAVIPPGGGLPWVASDASVSHYYTVWRVIEGVPTRILTPAIDTVLMNPRLSFDGNWVCVQGDWQEDSPFGAALYVAPALGGTTVEVWNDGGDQDYLLHPTWHPDNDQIVFTYGPGIPSPDLGFPGGIYRAQRTDPGVTPTSLWQPEIQTPQQEGAYRPHYSPDGTKIAFFVNLSLGSGGDPSRQGLWTMDADGSNDTLIDFWEDTLEDGGYAFVGTQLAWSNDSEWIAFTDSDAEDNGTNSVWKIRPDGTDKTLLKEGTGDGYRCRIGYGAWAADDSFVICSATVNPSITAWEIWRLEADGTGETMLIDATNGPAGPGDFGGVYGNPFTNRMEWTYSASAPGTLASAELDGTDQVTVDVSAELEFGEFFAGEGLEWL